MRGRDRKERERERDMEGGRDREEETDGSAHKNLHMQHWTYIPNRGYYLWVYQGPKRNKTDLYYS